MFSWICPKCGAEVPPSEDDCPRCRRAEQAAAAAAPPPQPPAPAPPAPPPFRGQPVTAPPPPPAADPDVRAYFQQHQPAPPPTPAAQPYPTYAVEPPKQGIPSWLVVLIVAIVLTGVGYVAYGFLPSVRARKAAAVGSEAKEETAAAKPVQAHPLGRHLELTGLRVMENAKKQLEVRMVVVNHSAAELPDMKITVDLKSTRSADPISTFTMTLPSLSAFESREVKAQATTTLRAYEFPDWQFLRADFQVVSP